MKKYIKLFLCIFAFFSCISLYAKDFGLILDQSAGISIPLGAANSVSSQIMSDYIDYSGALIPRFSTPVGDNGNVYISASAKAELGNNGIAIIPEILRTEYFHSFDRSEFKIGRMQYTDPLGFIANGLFDGASFSIDAGEGSVSIGAWYTGLLYKERANITMTQAEMGLYGVPLDYSNFADTYFAPSRVVSALGYEHQGLAERMILSLAIIGQFDLTGWNNLHSQYAAAKLSVPLNAFVFDIGGALEMIEYANKNNFAFAGILGISYIFTSARISLSGRYSSGVADNDSYTAFLPLTTAYQGDILKAKLSGLSVVSLDYLGRLNRAFSANLAASCFIRSDLGTYALPFSAQVKDGYIVGTEFFGRLWWSPVSDIQLNFGCGSFLSSLGNAYEGVTVLRAEINLILALY